MFHTIKEPTADGAETKATLAYKSLSYDNHEEENNIGEWENN